MFELRVFLEARRKRVKRPCPPGFMFCLKCHEPRSPSERMIDYVPLAATSGNLIGLCPKCSGLMFRRIKPDVARFQAALTGSADAPRRMVPRRDARSGGTTLPKPATSDSDEARL